MTDFLLDQLQILSGSIGWLPNDNTMLPTFEKALQYSMFIDYTFVLPRIAQGAIIQKPTLCYFWIAWTFYQPGWSHKVLETLWAQDPNSTLPGIDLSNSPSSRHVLRRAPPEAAPQDLRLRGRSGSGRRSGGGGRPQRAQPLVDLLGLCALSDGREGRELWKWDLEEMFYVVLCFLDLKATSSYSWSFFSVDSCSWRVLKLQCSIGFVLFFRRAFPYGQIRMKRSRAALTWRTTRRVVSRPWAPSPVSPLWVLSKADGSAGLKYVFGKCQSVRLQVAFLNDDQLTPPTGAWSILKANIECSTFLTKISEKSSFCFVRCVMLCSHFLGHYATMHFVSSLSLNLFHAFMRGLFERDLSSSDPVLDKQNMPTEELLSLAPKKPLKWCGHRSKEPTQCHFKLVDHFGPTKLYNSTDLCCSHRPCRPFLFMEIYH